MKRPKILVTGANGQLGKELRSLADHHRIFEFIFLSREDLPIHHFELVRTYFEVTQPAYCINCAAYTAVDRAEQEREIAFQVNGEAVGILAAVCKKNHTKLVHISTDYVFDGTSSTPYKEDDPTGPVSTYGASKLEGEKQAMHFNDESIIIRTSWLYSSHGHNFVRTMIRLMNERSEISVVNDQVGAPTYARDLAEAIIKIIIDAELSAESWKPGIYHYSNAGRISWYDFAVVIKEMINSNCKVNPISTSEYPTPAKRPAYSLLDTGKISKTFAVGIPDWRQSLGDCIAKLQ